MKKILSGVLVCALFLALLCGSVLAAEAADIVGLWHLASIEMDGTTINAADVSMVMNMRMDEDGAGALLADDQEEDPVIWKLEGDEFSMFPPSGEGLPMVMTYQDGKLFYEINGQFLIFEKETAAVVE